MTGIKRKCKDIAAIALRGAVRIFCRVFFVFPIQNNKIFFSSFAEARDYNCNPKYITEYLKQYYPGQYDLVWQFRKPLQHQNIEGIRTVKYHSLRWFYEMLTSHVLIINCSLSWLPQRKGQYVINTWHAGGAYKRVGKDIGGAGMFERWRARTQDMISLFLSSSDVFTKSNIQAWNYQGEILNSGMPRNDIFFDACRYDSRREKTRSELGIGEDEIAVLYAPTFRKGRKSAQELSFTFPGMAVITELQKRYGKKAHLIVRNHHADTHTYSYDAMTIDASFYEDMQELLCATDILITDYSSSMWDFALLGKPCLLYVPDLQEYISSDRGFFTEPETWPGIVCEDEKQLLQAITLLDEQACMEKAKQYLAVSGSYEYGGACKEVAKRIEEVIRPTGSHKEER